MFCGKHRFCTRKLGRCAAAKAKKTLAARRNLEDLSIGPVLTWTNEQMHAHVDAIAAIPGAELLFGGKSLSGHSIPDCYGAFEPTAVRVPLSAVAGEHFGLVTTELFGPFQVIVTWGDDDLPTVLNILERIQFPKRRFGCDCERHDLLRHQGTNDRRTAKSLVWSGWRSTRCRYRYARSDQYHLEPPSGNYRGPGTAT